MCVRRGGGGGTPLPSKAEWCSPDFCLPFTFIDMNFRRSSNNIVIVLLFAATSIFIPITQLCLPVRPSRQFRRVNSQFVDSLTHQLRREPSGSHGCLFMVAQDIANKDDFDIDKKDAYKYEVLGGTHLMLATKKLKKEDPESIYFRGRMARIYFGLTDEQAIYLGAMHQNTTSYCHEITYREEVS